MPVDTSIYANAVPPPPNPLATMGQVTQLIGGMNQNKLFAQEFAGRQAMGDVIKAATDPATGVTDWNKAMGLLSQDPRGARMLPEFAAQQLARQKTEIEMQQAAQTLAQQRFQAANAALGALLNKKGAGPGDALSTIRDLAVGGILPVQEALKWFDAVPRDEAQFTEFLKQAQVRAMTPAERKPTTQAIDTGGAVQVMQVGPTGAITNAGALPKTMDPAAAAEPVEIYDATTHQMRKVPKSVFARQTGAGGGGTAPAPSGAGGGVAAAPPLGAGEAAAEAGKGSGIALNELYTNVSGSAARIFQLQKAYEALDKAPTGPGTKTTNIIKSFLLAQTPFELGKYLPGVNVDEIKNYDEANKYLQQYARGQVAATGISEGSLASALSSNASTAISSLAAKDVVRANIGLERYRQAQAQAFDAAGEQPENFNKWNVTWNKQIDPRVFVTDLLTADELKTMVTGMNKADKAKFAEAHKWAKANGLLD